MSTYADVSPRILAVWCVALWESTRYRNLECYCRCPSWNASLDCWLTSCYCRRHTYMILYVIDMVHSRVTMGVLIAIAGVVVIGHGLLLPEISNGDYNTFLVFETLT